MLQLKSRENYTNNYQSQVSRMCRRYLQSRYIYIARYFIVFAILQVPVVSTIYKSQSGEPLTYNFDPGYSTTNLSKSKSERLRFNHGIVREKNQLASQFASHGKKYRLKVFHTI